MSKISGRLAAQQRPKVTTRSQSYKVTTMNNDAISSNSSTTFGGKCKLKKFHKIFVAVVIMISAGKKTNYSSTIT